MLWLLKNYIFSAHIFLEAAKQKKDLEEKRRQEQRSTLAIRRCQSDNGKTIKKL